MNVSTIPELADDYGSKKNSIIMKFEEMDSEHKRHMNQILQMLKHSKQQAKRDILELKQIEQGRKQAIQLQQISEGGRMDLKLKPWKASPRRIQYFDSRPDLYINSGDKFLQEKQRINIIRPEKADDENGRFLGEIKFYKRIFSDKSVAQCNPLLLNQSSPSLFPKIETSRVNIAPSNVKQRIMLQKNFVDFGEKSWD